MSKDKDLGDPASPSGASSLRSPEPQDASPPPVTPPIAALIAELSEAEFGAPRFDIAIDKIVEPAPAGQVREYRVGRFGEVEMRRRHAESWLHFYGIPRYTRDLEAALRLLPSNWTWQVSNRAPGNHQGRAYVHNNTLICAGVSGLKPNPEHRSAECTAATPALALAIVCLRILAQGIAARRAETSEAQAPCEAQEPGR